MVIKNAIRETMFKTSSEESASRPTENMDNSTHLLNVLPISRLSNCFLLIVLKKIATEKETDKANKKEKIKNITSTDDPDSIGLELKIITKKTPKIKSVRVIRLNKSDFISQWNKF